MENYIVINGKKAELTQEQLQQLGIEVEKKRNNPFNKVNDGEKYFYIDFANNVCRMIQVNNNDNDDYNAANYFNNKDFAKQVALHQLLYRKLLKYSYDNNAEDCDWSGKNLHYYICRDARYKKFIVNACRYVKHFNNVYFSNEKVARSAIDDIIHPFLEQYPEFVW